MLKVDIFLFVLDGRVPDNGACVELGIAYGHKFLLKRDNLIIGMHTDMRASFPHSKLKAMEHGPFDALVDNEDALIAALENHSGLTLGTPP